MRKAYHHGDLKDALIEETLTMIRVGERHLIGFRELARRLGVSRTAPYRHFSSVESLLAVVAEQGYGIFVKALAVVTADQKFSAKERFLELGVTYVNFALENPAHYRLMFEPKFFEDDTFSDVKRLARQAFGFLKQAASACMAPAASAEDNVQMANLAWASVHGMSCLFIDGQWNHIQDRQVFIRTAFLKLLQ